MKQLTLDDVVVLSAIGIVAVLCLTFRYLPMVDLPQHYAMVSILRHHGDPAWGFAQRYTFDFFGRPYATVYWLGAGLAWLMPLAAAMRIVVALCTIAPFLGAWTFLVETDRPRAPLLLALPFAFGSLWHWGFLNFLLGTGLFLAGLALVVRASKQPRTGVTLGLALLGAILLLTHFHGLVMLLSFAPVLAFAFAAEGELRRTMVRAVLPLAPAAVFASAFVLLTWRQAVGSWPKISPSLGERLARFDEFLGVGFLEPWPAIFAATLAIGMAAHFFLEAAPLPSRLLAALVIVLAGQVVLYLALPLNTNTATYVSARHALLIALFVVPLAPRVAGRAATLVRAFSFGTAALGLVVAARHLHRFDREARSFDGILEAIPQNRRILPVIFERSSVHVNPATFPYLHFAAYAQAAHGGELSRSFAVVWNVPIRYRADYARYPIREQVEWVPSMVTSADLSHFDLVLARGAMHLPKDLPLREVAHSGPWALFEIQQ